MTIIDKKTELSLEEHKAFIFQYKKGIIYMLYKEKLLTGEQLKQLLSTINK